MRKPVKIAVLAGVGAVLVAGASGAAAVAATNDRPDARPAAATSTADPGTGTDTATRSATRSGDRGAPTAAGVDRSAAEAAARKAVPGARVTEIDRDRENGVLVWEVDLTRNGHEYEVDVDAGTGKVVKVDRDRHDDGARDDHDDHGDHGDHDHDDHGDDD